MFVYIKDWNILYKWEEEYQNWVVFFYDTVIKTIYTVDDSIIYTDWVIKLFDPEEYKEKEVYIPPTFEEIKNIDTIEWDNTYFESIRNENVSLFIKSNYA